MEIESQLKKLGIKPVKGQNFLKSNYVIEALIEAAEIENHNVLEIGAGTGKITEKLSEKAGKIYAVEKDTILAQHLKQQEIPRTQIINKDILEYEMPEIDRCIGNIPFQISSEIIEKLGKKQVQSALIMQKELVEKAVQEPGDSNYGRFTIMVNYYFLPVKLREISRKNYYPEPEVDTAIIKLYPNKERHDIDDEEKFFEMTKALFTHKRKKVRNAFVDSRHILNISKDEAKQIRDELPHSETRVVNLNVKEISEIAGFFNKNF